MKKNLKTQLSSMEAVLAVCLEYPLVIALLLALSNAVTGLSLKIQSILSTEGKQQLNNKGITLTKKKLKKSMRPFFWEHLQRHRVVLINRSDFGN